MKNCANIFTKYLFLVSSLLVLWFFFCLFVCSLRVLGKVSRYLCFLLGCWCEIVSRLGRGEMLYLWRCLSISFSSTLELSRSFALSLCLSLSLSVSLSLSLSLSLYLSLYLSLSLSLSLSLFLSPSLLLPPTLPCSCKNLPLSCFPSVLGTCASTPWHP